MRQITGLSPRMCSQWGHPVPYLLQPVEHGDEEADIGQPLVVEIPDALHQLRGGRDCRQNEEEARVLGWGGWGGTERGEMVGVCGGGGEEQLQFRAGILGPWFFKCI